MLTQLPHGAAGGLGRNRRTGRNWGTSGRGAIGVTVGWPLRNVIGPPRVIWFARLM